MKIVVGTDESRPVVDQLVAHLKSKGHTVDALPAETWGRMAAHTARLVADRSYDRGIVCCWTGTGASIKRVERCLSSRSDSVRPVSTA